MNTKSTWSEWEAPKGFQPVADCVVVEYLYQYEDEEPHLLQEKAGDLQWEGMSGGMLSYRYQILSPEEHAKPKSPAFRDEFGRLGKCLKLLDEGKLELMAFEEECDSALMSNGCPGFGFRIKFFMPSGFTDVSEL